MQYSLMKNYEINIAPLLAVTVKFNSLNNFTSKIPIFTVQTLQT